MLAAMEQFQHLASHDEPPGMDRWQEAMSKSSENEASKLRQHALRCLDRDVRWTSYVGEAERIMRERGIDF
jgi:hypothetical protein